MTNQEYHSHMAVSKSDLDLIARSPAHFKYIKEHKPEQTDAMLLGSVVHKLVLEPATFAAEYAVAPAVDRRTKAGKETWAEFSKAIGSETIISSELYSKAHLIAESVKSNKIASKLLSGGKAEQSFFWADSQTGIECKCRPDYLKGNIAVDLKTTLNASPEEFVKSAYNYRYHVQAWWYLEGLRQNGINAADFIFIAVEKEPPYSVCIYCADELMLELGERKARENLSTYAECLKSGIWHGYEKEPQIHSLSLPDWVIRKEF